MMQVAPMINLFVKPRHELEAARGAVEILLRDHGGLLTEGLSTELSSLASDLKFVISQAHDSKAEV